MYRNPNYPAPEQAPRSAPEPSGREVAVFERPGKGRGPDSELRLTLDEYMGSQYIGLRVWSRGPDGAWYPTRKGCSIRLREAENLATNLLEALRLAGVAEDQAAKGPRRDERRSGPGPRRSATAERHRVEAPLMGRPVTEEQRRNEDFDEFEG